MISAEPEHAGAAVRIGVVTVSDRTFRGIYADQGGTDTRGRSLIVNLPGKPSAIAECLALVFPAIPYCIDLIGGPWIEMDPAVCISFRPKGA